MNNSNYTGICIRKDVNAKIDRLAKICRCSKAELINKLVSPIYEVAKNKRCAELESYPIKNRDNVIFQVYVFQKMDLEKLSYNGSD